MAIILDEIKTCKSCLNCITFGSEATSKSECNSKDYIHQNNFKEDGICAASYCNGYTAGSCSNKFKMNNEYILRYIRGGKAEFVLHSTKTNEDFTYITEKQSNVTNTSWKELYYLNIIQDNTKKYAGILVRDNITSKYKFMQGKKGECDGSEIDIRSLVYVMNKLEEYKDDLSKIDLKLIAYNNGICSKCGIKLNEEEQQVGLCARCRKVK